MIDRAKLKTGQIILVRGGVDWISKLDGYGQIGLVPPGAQEFGHVAVVMDDGFGAETRPPYPKMFPISAYDAAFDAGHVRILEHKNFIGPDMRKDFRSWVSRHLWPNFPYGWESIAIMGLERVAAIETLDGINGWMRDHPLPTNFQHSPVCSQFAWMALCEGLGYDFAARYGIGPGQMMPGSFAGMDCFDISQDLKS